MGFQQALRTRLPNWALPIIAFFMPLSARRRRALYFRFLEADRRVACRVLGVPTGFVEQVRGSMALAYARFRAPAPPTLTARGANLRAKGIEILGPVVPESALAPLVSCFKERLASDSTVRIVKEGAMAYEGEISFRAEDLSILTPVMVPEIIDALRAATGSGFRVVNYTAWRIYHLDLAATAQGETYSEKWHSDGLRTDLYKVFVFLSNVTREDGGTMIADRDTTRAACRAGYRHRTAYGGADSILAAIERQGGICGPAGTAYVANTSFCLHRAGVPGPGRHRDMLQIKAIAAPRVDLTPMPPESLSWIDRMHLL